VPNVVIPPEEELLIRNCGFVNCEWAIKGVLKANRESKIFSEGKTYDDKLYTFRECDYRTLWHSLDIIVKRLNQNNQLKNLNSSDETDNEMDEGKTFNKALDSNGLDLNKMELSLSSRNGEVAGAIINGPAIPSQACSAHPSSKKIMVQQDIMPDYMTV